MLYRDNMHEYQTFCVEYAKERAASGIFLSCGLGKTAVTLTVIDDLMHDDFEISKTLIIAPLRVAASVWDTEALKWDHLKHLRISKALGTKKERLRALDTPADIYIINRENVADLVNHYGTAFPFDCVVIDELSSFKNPSSQRFKALRRVRPLIKRIIGLTGTPTPNGLIDLWAQLYLLDRGARLGKTVGYYRELYFTPGRRNGYVVYDWKLKRGAEKHIYERIGDICVSMKASDYIKTPERVDVVYPVPLDDKARAAYTEMEREEILALSDGIVDAGSAAAVTGKLLQLANGAVYDDERRVHEVHAAKLDALEDLIEAANGRSVLVFYAYQHDLSRIRERFPQAVKLEDSETIEAWNKGEIPLMLAHPAGAGHGLNLQDGGSIIVWFGLTWSLELYQQANARLDRQGQKESVTVYHLVTEGTVDEEVMTVLSGKAVTQAAMMDAVKARVTKYAGGANDKKTA